MENELIVKYKAMLNSQALDEFEEEEKLLSISSVSRPAGKIIKYQIPEGVDPQELAAEYSEKGRSPLGRTKLYILSHCNTPGPVLQQLPVGNGQYKHGGNRDLVL